MINSRIMLTLTRAIFLAFIWSMPALLWSTNAFYWEEPDNCQWQLQQPAVPSLEWATLTADTIRPIFATHSCDLVCPDFQVDWIAVNAICGEHNGKITVFPVGYPAGTIFTITGVVAAAPPMWRKTWALVSTLFPSP